MEHDLSKRNRVLGWLVSVFAILTMVFMGLYFHVDSVRVQQQRELYDLYDIVWTMPYEPAHTLGVHNGSLWQSSDDDTVYRVIFSTKEEHGTAVLVEDITATLSEAVWLPLNDFQDYLTLISY